MNDPIDIAILKILQDNGRISNVEIAQQINLSSPAVHTRIKKMERAGLIKSYAAILNPEKLLFKLTCFISIGVQLHQADQLTGFRKSIVAMPEVMECYNITGEYDYLIKVVVPNRKGLQVLVEELTRITGVSRLYTRIVIDELKSTTALPLDNI